MNLFFYLAGIVFLALAKLKNAIHGYSSPKTFSISETARCIDYDIGVVEAWLSRLQNYARADNGLVGKSVLELGLGSDLGVGLYLLSKGCAKYNACDVNDLMKSVPNEFYERLFEKLGKLDRRVDLGFLRNQWQAAQAGRPSRLNYVVSAEFDLVRAFGATTMDLVFSRAAFEHFDDIDATISQLSTISKPGAIMVVEIDLKTHSRWIRDHDPNNIYRYSRRVYDAFWFRGSPNRARPNQYIKALARHGWNDISMVPLTKIKGRGPVGAGLHPDFAAHENQMDYLSIALVARKGETA